MIRAAVVLGGWAALGYLGPAALALAVGHAGAAVALFTVAVITDGWGQWDRVCRLAFND